MGAQAQVIETEMDARRRDEIVATYEKMQDELEALAEAARFWGEVNTHPEFTKFVSKLRDELSELRERWDDIKPSDFRDSQSRVRAIKVLTKSLTSKPEDVAEALKAKKRLVYNYEIENEIFLRAAGYEFDDQPPEEEVQADEAEDNPMPGHLDAKTITFVIQKGFEGEDRDIFEQRLASTPFKPKGGRSSEDKRTYTVQVDALNDEEKTAVESLLDEFEGYFEEVRYD